MVIQLLVLFLYLMGLEYFTQQRSLKGWDNDRTRRYYIIFCCVLLILQSGLRNVTVGTDTYAYKLTFEAIEKQSWLDLFDGFYRVYVLGQGKDAGYYLFVKIFHVFSDNYQVYLIAIAVLFFASLGRFICLNTNNLRGVFVAMCVYQVFFYGFFSITGIRQTIATAFVLFAYDFVIKRHLILFLLLCFMAALIHKSALLFIPFYFLSNFKYPVKALSIILILLPVIFVLIRPITRFLTSFSFSESYASYANSTYETQGAQMFFVYILNGFCLALFFTPLTWVDPSLMRVVMYYSIFTLFLLGDLVDCFNSAYSKSSNNIVILILIVFCAVLIRRNADYAFFWEQMALGSNY